MMSFLKGIIFCAIVAALTGCAGSGVSLSSSLAPPIKQEYEIFNSSYDKAFEMAHQAMAETELEIYNVDKRAGKIEARADRTAEPVGGDSKTFVMKYTEFKFNIREVYPQRILFSVECKSSSGDQNYINNFIEKYSTLVDLSELSGEAPESYIADEKPILSSSRDERMISDIRSTYMYEQESPEFTKQEIIHIQTVLYRLGYDPGPADGTMNKKTRAAIERFKIENEVLSRLF